jgi:hypothetical protein
MPSDQFVPVTVPLYYQGHAYRAGSRIRVRVSAPNGDQPIWSFSETEPAGTAEVEIGYGEGMPSRLVLPQVPGVTVPAQLPPCPGLRGEPCRDYVPFQNDTSLLEGFPRPMAATPTYLPMAVAYGACGSATKVHAAPLAWGSCTAQPASSQLTVGTPDANSRPANGSGWVRLKAILDDTATPADESDLSIGVNAEDVRIKADLTDYAGELRLSSVVRSTDKRNSPAPTASGLGAATLEDFTFGASVPCTPTVGPAGTPVGSTCAVSTTVNALTPGLVVGGARAIWALDQVTLYDGGPDSDGDTAAGNTPFMRQGIFAP